MSLPDSNIKISIIIPIYNRATLISETLYSIVNQTHTNWECLIVDDGSTDNLRDVIKGRQDRDDRIRYSVNKKDRTPSIFLPILIFCPFVSCGK